MKIIIGLATILGVLAIAAVGVSVLVLVAWILYSIAGVF